MTTLRLTTISFEQINFFGPAGNTTTYLYEFDGVDPDDGNSPAHLTMMLDTQAYAIGDMIDLIVS